MRRRDHSEYGRARDAVNRNVTDAIASQRRGVHPLDGFAEAQHRIHRMVLALTLNGHQGLALQKQATRLKTTEGPVLQKQTVHLGGTTVRRAARVPGRALGLRCGLQQCAPTSALQEPNLNCPRHGKSSAR